MPLKSFIREYLLGLGAAAAGFAEAAPVEARCTDAFRAWLRDGRHGPLGYMERHSELRTDPRGLLEGAKTVVSVAWPYLPERLRDPALPFIARYAYCADYHKVIRRLLKPLLRELAGQGIRTRLCVDSAPVHERYWAVRAGIGFRGRNGCLIVPGAGSWVFLSEILLDAEIAPDAPCTASCDACDACLRACPTGALTPDGTLDCRRCLSARTIEAPVLPVSSNAVSSNAVGTLPEAPPATDGNYKYLLTKGALPEALLLRRQNFRPLAGCDRCQEVCPHNRGVAPTRIPAFATLPQILTLDEAELRAHTPDTFAARYAGTSLQRPGLNRLLTNLQQIF